jgi:hypothetical protein
MNDCAELVGLIDLGIAVRVLAAAEIVAEEDSESWRRSTHEADLQLELSPDKQHVGRSDDICRSASHCSSVLAMKICGEDFSTLTDQPVGPRTTSANNDQAKTEDGVESDSLSPRDGRVPCDNAGQHYSVEVTDRSANASSGIDDVAVFKALIIRSESILDVECHPIGLRGLAVDEKHDAEGDGVHDGEYDGEPYAPVPSLRVRPCN